MTVKTLSHLTSECEWMILSHIYCHVAVVMSGSRAPSHCYVKECVFNNKALCEKKPLINITSYFTPPPSTPPHHSPPRHASRHKSFLILYWLQIDFYPGPPPEIKVSSWPINPTGNGWSKQAGMSLLLFVAHVLMKDFTGNVSLAICIYLDMLV